MKKYSFFYKKSIDLTISIWYISCAFEGKQHKYVNKKLLNKKNLKKFKLSIDLTLYIWYISCAFERKTIPNIEKCRNLKKL